MARPCISKSERKKSSQWEQNIFFFQAEKSFVSKRKRFDPSESKAGSYFWAAELIKALLLWTTEQVTNLLVLYSSEKKSVWKINSGADASFAPVALSQCPWRRKKERKRDDQQNTSNYAHMHKNSCVWTPLKANQALWGIRRDFYNVVETLVRWSSLTHSSLCICRLLKKLKYWAFFSKVL